MRWFLVVLALLQPCGTVRAEVAGQGDPGFVAAQNLWLAGDEAQSLPALSRLAQDGNTAAQLLLGVIDTTAGLQGDWLMALPRQGRIDLLRAPGGISGMNWLRLADDPIARAWLQLWDGQATAEVILTFARLGEARAAREAGLVLAARQKSGFGAVADDPVYPHALLALAIRDWRLHDPDRARAAEAALPPGDPQHEVLDFTPRATPQALTEWIATAPEGAPLLAFCANQCPSEPAPVCHAAALGAVGGYFGLMRLGAPVEALMPSPDFNRSPMGIATILRQIRGEALARRLSVPPPTGSACLDRTLQK
jgi:hypothetical protein